MAKEVKDTATPQQQDKQQQQDQDQVPAPNWRQIIGSVLAAAFGVQSKENRERDFEHGKPVVFIVAGIVFTVLFVVAMIAIVTTVIETAS